MVLDFLNSLKEAYSNSLDVTQNELDRILREIRETEKFIDMLEKETESSFTQFTPRNVSNKNTKKIEELNTQLSELHSQEEFMQKSYDDVTKWLRDIEDCISEVNETMIAVPTKSVSIDSSKRERLVYDGGSKENSGENASSEKSSSVGKKSVKVQSNSVQRENSGTEDKSSLDRENLTKHLSLVMDYLPADPMRARIELKNILDSL